ncbi:hypothetical protein HRG_009898 [Hirsutella rhossiliensis]|uniref:Uncharacterized protein n=1 Tax=Hirsutella rhossiliensis TaxID=111463 RepID=A0A9P8MNR9_9HYPO|nr:uncharacterized protein HRG_09898 [Hirsutella rhossiliensis]KAH0958853.1 hypothetical protein HRG_09898 [Hirsutella rhossiliensis]
MAAAVRLLISRGPASLDDDGYFHCQDVELTTFNIHGRKRSPSIASTSSSSSPSSSSSSFVASPPAVAPPPRRRSHRRSQDARHGRSLSIVTLLSSSSSSSSSTSLYQCPSPSLVYIRGMTADQRRKLADQIWREIW